MKREKCIGGCEGMGAIHFVPKNPLFSMPQNSDLAGLEADNCLLQTA